MTKRKNTPYEITDAMICHLKACKAQGLTLSAACKELRIPVQTFRVAARRQGLFHIVDSLYPLKRSGMKQVPYKEGMIDDLIVAIKGDAVLRAMVKPWLQNKQGR